MEQSSEAPDVLTQEAKILLEYSRAQNNESPMRIHGKTLPECVEELLKTKSFITSFQKLVKAYPVLNENYPELETHITSIKNNPFIKDFILVPCLVNNRGKPFSQALAKLLLAHLLPTLTNEEKSNFEEYWPGRLLSEKLTLLGFDIALIPCEDNLFKKDNTHFRKETFRQISFFITDDIGEINRIDIQLIFTAIANLSLSQCSIEDLNYTGNPVLVNFFKDLSPNNFSLETLTKLKNKIELQQQKIDNHKIYILSLLESIQVPYEKLYKETCALYGNSDPRTFNNFSLLINYTNFIKYYSEIKSSYIFLTEEDFYASLSAIEKCLIFPTDFNDCENLYTLTHDLKNFIRIKNAMLAYEKIVLNEIEAFKTAAKSTKNIVLIALSEELDKLFFNFLCSSCFFLEKKHDEFYLTILEILKSSHDILEKNKLLTTAHKILELSKPHKINAILYPDKHTKISEKNIFTPAKSDKNKLTQKPVTQHTRNSSLILSG